jgi:hypothetical protein
MSAGAEKESTETMASSESDIGVRGYAKGSPLEDRRQCRSVSFQIIWRLFSHAMWRIMLRTKDADSNDRIGFVVGVRAEDRFGAIPITPASPGRESRNLLRRI